MMRRSIYIGRCRLIFVVSLLLIFNYQDPVSGAGVFQIQPLAFVNEDGITATGSCCTGSRTNGRCRAPCRTYLQLCLSHYQAGAPSDGTCTFGNVTTSVLGKNVIIAGSTTISIPFEFRWPGSFTLTIEAWHRSIGATDLLIFRSSILDTVDAGTGWHTYENASDNGQLLTLKFRITCNDTYFGSGCSESCQPRDDKFGHYTCSPTGMKICHTGWSGLYCDKAVCLDGCDPVHGYCDDPNECKCRLGWQGKLCRQCIPYPGCQHGSCDQPWQCNCKEGWGGLFCNQDLHFCTNYQPCRNGGTCTNAGQGSYECTCPPGFTGATCELEVEDCYHVPCENGGNCSLINDSFRCVCPPKFYGGSCQWPLSMSCDLGPCRNNGTCSERNGQYHCSCHADFTGLNCETRQDACSPAPCLNGGRCVANSGGRTFTCLCRNGYSGQFCQDDHNHCAGGPCLNDATCLPDDSEGFVCRCVPGFVGVLCQDNVDDCLNYPCANGAECVDLVNDFRCVCASGFSGRYCSENVSSCAHAPCSNGATCVDSSFGFECLCPTGYHGNRCEGEDMTVPLLIATQDKQIIDVDNSPISTQQIVLIAVLGVGLPVIIMLAAVVFVVIRRRRRHGDVKNDVSNVCNLDMDGANNVTGKRLADVAGNKFDDAGSRPVKITNKERQEALRESDRHRNIFTVGHEYGLDAPYPCQAGHVTVPRDQNCSCNEVHRTCVCRTGASLTEQRCNRPQMHLDAPPPKLAFPVRASDQSPTTEEYGLPRVSESQDLRPSNNRNFVFATEV